MMLFYLKKKENKIRFGPPPQKKRLRDTIGRDMATRTSVIPSLEIIIQS